MPLLDLGVSYDQAQEESAKQQLQLPEGPYQVQCKSCESVISKKNTPQLKWTFAVINNANPDYNGKELMTWTPVPSKDNMKGVGFLVNVTVGLGKPWNGTTINTDDYIGAEGGVNLKKDKEGKYVQIDSWI